MWIQKYRGSVKKRFVMWMAAGSIPNMGEGAYYLECNKLTGAF